MIELVMEILKKARTKETNIPPTLLYNEGWMIRLLIDVSIKHGIHINGLDFSKVSKWYSEGLISSPFLPRYRGDKLAEGYTHADIIFGDFEIYPFDRGDIHINNEGEIIGIIEAKMGNPLSSGTKNQPDYDQASRILACLAFNTFNTNHELYFILVAPEVKIGKSNFEKIVSLDYMIPRIEKRFDLYKEKDVEIFKKKEATIERAKTCNCFVVSYEKWLKEISDTKGHSQLKAFYDLCKEFNRIG